MTSGAKGLTERNNGYFETSFLPGRRFAGPEDFNARFAGWLAGANTRHSRSLGCAPTARWAAGRAAMAGLPPSPPAIGWASVCRQQGVPRLGLPWSGLSRWGDVVIQPE